MRYKDEITISIPTSNIQLEAERLIGRKLTDSEILEIQRRVELGVSSGIDLIYKAAIFDSVSV